MWLQAEAAGLIVDMRKLEEEKEQLLLQLDDADKAGLEAETLLQATSGKIETLEKARTSAIQVLHLSETACQLCSLLNALCSGRLLTLYPVVSHRKQE